MFRHFCTNRHFQIATKFSIVKNAVISKLNALQQTLKHLTASQLSMSFGDGKISPGQHTAWHDHYNGYTNIVVLQWEKNKTLIVIIHCNLKQKHLIPYILIPKFHLNVILLFTTWFYKTFDHTKNPFVRWRHVPEIRNVFPRFWLKENWWISPMKNKTAKGNVILLWDCRLKYGASQ